jgi:PAS domain S-box-containing protein
LAQAEFAALVERAEGSVFTKDPAGMMLTWNNGAQRMFGYTGDEMVGRHIAVLIPEEWRAEEEETRRLVVETRMARECRTVLVGKDGVQNPVMMALTPVPDRYGRTRGILNLSRRVGV